MPIVTEAADRDSLYQFVDSLMAVHGPVLLIDTQNRPWILSAEDARLIHETLDLSNLPEIHRAILDEVNSMPAEQE